MIPTPAPTKFAKHLPGILPQIPNRKSRKIQITCLNSKQPTQQSLLLDILDINQSLNNKCYTCHLGHLFTAELNDKVINDLHDCLKRHTAIMEDGFSLWSVGKPIRTTANTGNPQFKRLSQKIDTLNQKMLKLSLQNVYDYDLYKYLQIIKYNKNVWSLYKRLDHHDILMEQSNKKLIYSHHHKNKTNNHSQTSSLHTSLLTKPKYSFQMQQKNIQKNVNYKKDRKLNTQINPQDQQSFQISKYDVKRMLKQQGDYLIFMYLPPSTYPQFNGMFTYSNIHKLPTCKLKKYFFFKRSLNQRFFNAIIQQISSRQARYIQAIELATSRNDYSKVYQPLGWKMKSLQGIDKFRIKFNRQTQ